MFRNTLEGIPYVAGAKSIRQLVKGFSNDEKYVLDETYLVRLFPLKEADKRKKEFELVQTCATHSAFVPKALEFGHLPADGKAYMVLTYTPGKDGEEALPALSEQEQYQAGFVAGQELAKLHQIRVNEDWPSWEVAKKQKSDRYLSALEKIEELDPALKQLLKGYIGENEWLMKGRPNRFQHDDFHPANMIIDRKRFVGLVDFGRFDFGDPIHDLQKLGFFSVRVSIPFSIGVIDGYHNGEKPGERFWQLYALYSAMHVVSAIVWGKQISEDQYDTLLAYSLDVVNDHHDFTEIIPSWYRQKEGMPF